MYQVVINASCNNSATSSLCPGVGIVAGAWQSEGDNLWLEYIGCLPGELST